MQRNKRNGCVNTPTKAAAPEIPVPRRMVSEVAIETRYGISRRTLQRWRLQGRGPRFYKLGRIVRYDLRDVEAWVNSKPTGGETLSGQ